MYSVLGIVFRNNFRVNRLSSAQMSAAPAQMSAVRTAAIIIIGDEILKGQTRDTNSYFLSKRLRHWGVRLEKISVIPDDIDTIATEVADYSKRFDIVITSGGIGPTHDDLTFEGVAKAFDDVTAPHPKIVQFVKEWFKTDDPNAPALKLAQIPSRSILHFGVDKHTGKALRFPIISLENVHLFPGIPQLLERAFYNLEEQLLGSLSNGNKFFTSCFYLKKPETSIADELNEIVDKFQSHVQFGSYPQWTHNYYKVKLTLESLSEEQLKLAEEDVRTKLPIMDNFDPDYTENAMEKIQNLIQQSDDPVFRSAVEQSLTVISKCFDDYSPTGVSVCFNGGKDSIVMQHLVHAYFHSKFNKGRLKALYIKENDPFSDMEQFIEKTEGDYGLDAIILNGPMKQALAQMLREHPDVKATVIGTRKGDPGAKGQGSFSPTDGDWPSVMRVNPILHWEYAHVWTFIRGLSLPYPILYDQGYTSLGSARNTLQNPALKSTDQDGKETYLPAYMLTDGDRERDGRTKS